MAQTTKTVRILNRKEYPLLQKVYFCQTDEETNECLTELTLDTSIWEDLGRPDIVTVTVEPGDMLNLPGEEWASRTELVDTETNVSCYCGKKPLGEDVGHTATACVVD